MKSSSMLKQLFHHPIMIAYKRSGPELHEDLSFEKRSMLGPQVDLNLDRHIRVMKRAREKALDPQIRVMRRSEAVLEPQIRVMRSSESVLEPQIRVMRSAESPLASQIRVMRSAETPLASQIRVMRSAESPLASQIRVLRSGSDYKPQIRIV